MSAAEPEQPASVPDVEVLSSSSCGGAGPAGVLRAANFTDRGITTIKIKIFILSHRSYNTLWFCCQIAQNGI